MNGRLSEKSMHFSIPILSRRLLALVTLIGATPVGAQTTYTWTGATSGNWATASNWTPVGIPGTDAGDKAQFGNVTRTSITLAQDGDINADSLIFLTSAPTYTITLSSGSDSDLLNGIINQSGAPQKFILAAGANLNFIGGNAANSLITSAGALQFDAALGNPTITSQSGGNIFVANSSPVDASAATVINESNSDFVADGSTLSIGSLSGAGNIKIFSDLALGGLGNDDTISGVISDQSGGGALTKTGNGILTLTNANTFTGPTTVQSGTLQVDGSLASTGDVVVSGTPESAHATLGGGGSVGHVTLRSGAILVPGNAEPNSKLTMASLSCTTGNNPVFQRIGSNQNNGDAFQGTYLILQSSLSTGTCPSLAFAFLSAGKPLFAGETFPIAIIDGTTNYTSASLTYGFANFPGYTQASGHFLVVPVSASLSLIDFIVDDVGDDIFKDGFQ
jgi:autotransporter-associated beta strand protein